jgi:capsular polysaccharide transport system ATP-binding protein
MAEPAILLDGVAKRYGARQILHGATLALPRGRRIGILGPNGAGKSTLLRLLAGTETPDAGRITRCGRVSFPLGFSGTFHPELSGRENLRFLARVYGQSPEAMAAQVAEFAELGTDIDAPVGRYSSGMAAKLAFGASLALDFDTYLVDEITEVGDARFRARSQAAFRERLRHATLILVSHNSQTIRSLCDCCAILHDGALLPFATVEEGLARYAEFMGVADA